MNYNYTVAERFMRYVQIDTQSDPEATCFPSTEKQKDLARVLEQELKDIGLASENIYVRHADVDSFPAKNLHFGFKIFYPQTHGIICKNGWVC